MATLVMTAGAMSGHIHPEDAMSVLSRTAAERPAVESELVTYRDVAELLRVSEKTVTRLPVPGRVAVGRLVRFDRRRVLDWITAGCPVPGGN